MKLDEQSGRIINLIEGFTGREDISLKFANQIEVALDDCFPDDNFMQDTVVMLASYCPGGGKFLYDEAEMIARLLLVKKKLEMK
ncbi:hypothetical protein WH96_01865 [Kiloniella spongiae]|uniref:Colicin D immunity protein domain-containing protein n=1 Tax=Kiloniella spongiae TaxID=1489064 RepID=A0A0H2MPI4_9PROT|nr:hypothetical protein [Kiloniella spongiae]KLN62647.1 hypothetical protein WH96_01865 [Kiloniella spongiae]